jgi:hypothetical protein
MPGQAQPMQASLAVGSGNNLTNLNVLAGFESAINGKTMIGFCAQAGSVIQIRYYDNTVTATAANNGDTYNITGYYECQP